MSRRVLITGGASGLGRALAEHHAAAGDRVLVADRDRPGLSTDDRPFWEVFGLFRLAVIAQQTYRHHHRQTRNPAFRNLWPAVHHLDHRCRTTIRRTRGG
ncbi:hypothetical protein [Streptomyces cinereoruber]